MPVGARKERTRPWAARLAARPRLALIRRERQASDAEEVDHEDERLVRADDTAGAPLAVGLFGGITRRRRPPTFMPATPSSQPAMTWPAPRRNSKVSPRSHEASNCWRVRHETPT